MFPPKNIVVSDDVSLEFDMSRNGCASLAFSIGPDEVKIDGFTDMKNSFHDFAFAAISAASCGREGFIRFNLDGEPTTWRWTVHSCVTKSLGYFSNVRVEYFDDGNPVIIDDQGQYVRRFPDVPGKVLFDAYCKSEAFSHAVRRAFEPLEKMGQTFEEVWCYHPFPTRTLAALDAALDTPPPEMPGEEELGTLVLSTKKPL